MQSMSDQKIPTEKWMQIHESILLLDFLAHETSHNRQGINRINDRIKIVGLPPFNIVSSGLITGLAWMILGRLYEVINDHIADAEFNRFQKCVAEQAIRQSSISTYEELLTRYRLNINLLQGENKSEFQQTLWKLIKHLRNAISHVDYNIDLTNGDDAQDAKLVFYHRNRGTVKLSMSATVSDFFEFTKHYAVWVNSALQDKDFLM